MLFAMSSNNPLLFVFAQRTLRSATAVQRVTFCEYYVLGGLSVHVYIPGGTLQVL